MRITTPLIALFLLAFLVYPLIYLLAGVFDSSDLALPQLLSHLGSPYELRVVLNSFAIAIGTTAVALLVGAPLAWAVSAYDFFGRNLIRTIVIFPMLMPPFVGALGIRKLFSRFGSLNLALLNLGISDEPIDWLGSGGPRGIVLIQGLHAFPIVYFAISSGLRNYDMSLEEAATVSGARLPTIIRRIRLPLLGPALLGSALIVAVSSLTDLGTPLLFEYRSVIAVRLFDMLSDLNENPLAYGLILELAALCTLLFIISQKLLQRGRVESGGRIIRPITRLQLRAKGHLFLIPLLALLLVLSIAPHLAILLLACGKDWVFSPLPSSLSLEAVLAVFSHPLTIKSLILSICLAAAAATLDLILGFSLSYAEARRSSRPIRALAVIGNLPLAIPGLVLAFGFFTAFTGTILDPRGNPLPLLAIAYAVRRLPFMLHLVRAGLSSLSISLEEAARALGASPTLTLRRITLPLLAGHLTSGFLLCFAFSVLEVSDSLILALEEKFYPVSKAIYALAGRPDGVPLAAALALIMTTVIITCLTIASRIAARQGKFNVAQVLGE